MREISINQSVLIGEVRGNGIQCFAGTTFTLNCYLSER